MPANAELVAVSQPETKNDVSLFDQSAHRFGSSIDSTIERGAYERGRVIENLAVKLLRPRARILDYGCGPGRLAVALARKDFVVAGADRSVGMLSEARDYAAATGNSQIAFSEITADWSRQACGSYDAVLCSSVIEYIPDPIGFLGEIRSLLVPDGILLLSFANRLSLWRKYAEFRFGAKQPHFALQHNIWNWRECKKNLRAGGFGVISSPRYFESIFDFWPAASVVAKSRFVGTLGLVGARRLG
jgi:SAM-dependent methyltransferase